MKRLSLFKNFKPQNTNEGLDLPSDFETQDPNTIEFEDATGFYKLSNPLATNSNFFTIYFTSKTPSSYVVDSDEPGPWLSHYSASESAKSWIQDVISDYINVPVNNQQQDAA
jgi:hypothetical protein